MDQAERHSRPGGETGVILTEERLDAAIRSALLSLMGSHVPSPAHWARIRRRILRSRRMNRRATTAVKRAPF